MKIKIGVASAYEALGRRIIIRPFAGTFKFTPFLFPPLCVAKSGIPFTVTIRELNHQGFDFVCKNLDGTPHVQRDDVIYWIAFGN